MSPPLPPENFNHTPICNSCSSQKEISTNFRCSGCKARWYCGNICQTKDRETHKPLCKTIQNPATKYEEADLGRRDGDDPHTFKTYLTPKQQHKLIKLVRKKCQVRCKLNGIELTALRDTGAQIILLSKKQLKEHFGDVEIQDIKAIAGWCYRIRINHRERDTKSLLWVGQIKFSVILLWDNRSTHVSDRISTGFANHRL